MAFLEDLTLAEDSEEYIDDLRKFLQILRETEFKVEGALLKMSSREQLSNDKG